MIDDGAAFAINIPQLPLQQLQIKREKYKQQVLSLHICGSYVCQAIWPSEWYSLGMSGIKRGSEYVCGAAWVERVLRFLIAGLATARDLAEVSGLELAPHHLQNPEVDQRYSNPG